MADLTTQWAGGGFVVPSKSEPNTDPAPVPDDGGFETPAEEKQAETEKEKAS